MQIMTLLETIENLLEEVRSASDYASRPQINGRLKVRHRQGTLRYFHITREEKYLGKNCRETIKALEEKYYCAELLKTAGKEIESLDKIKKILEAMPDYKSVFLNIPQEKRHLISPYEKKFEEKEESRIRVFNKKYVSEELKLVTQNGEQVRSKSELIIADRLKAADIPYFYEDPLIMEEDNKENEALRECLYWHPDFRVLNKRTGKQYYWEHFGMLDNPEYCKSCQEKLEIYAQYGYFAGDNLIITSESTQHGLNTKYVDCLIERYLK